MLGGVVAQVPPESEEEEASVPVSGTAASTGGTLIMLRGRLGLERARIPHSDRHGLVWLDRGRLEVEDGCLRFVTAGGGELAAGDYQVPHQAVSIILLGPGSSVTHDALRLLARHGCCLAAIGEGAVRFYTAPPLMPDTSALARAQVSLWSDPARRMEVARAMYAMRFGDFSDTDRRLTESGLEISPPFPGDHKISITNDVGKTDGVEHDFYAGL